MGKEAKLERERRCSHSGAKGGGTTVRILVGIPVAPADVEFIPRLAENIREMEARLGEPVDVVFATENEEIKAVLEKFGDVVLFHVPDSPHRLVNIAAARNAIRDYFLSGSYEYLVFLDADMVYGSDLLKNLVALADSGKCDVIYNIYRLRTGQKAYSGFGGTLIRRWVLAHVKFRAKVVEGRVVYDEVAPFRRDALKLGARICRGIFAWSNHRGKVLTPHELNWRDVLAYRIGDFLVRNVPEFMYIRLAVRIRRAFKRLRPSRI